MILQIYFSNKKFNFISKEVITSIHKKSQSKIPYRFITVFTAFLSPILVFPWGESMHPISEVLIHHIVLTEDYVFCGSDASWGTNEFGLFVFNRKENTWENYSKGNEFPFNTIKGMEKEEKYLYVNYRSKIVRFDLTTMEYEITTDKTFEAKGGIFGEYRIGVGEDIYKLLKHSIIKESRGEETEYLPANLPPGFSELPESQEYGYWFSTPILLNNKIYFAYNFSAGPSLNTRGLGSFDLNSKTFKYYPSDIFKSGSISDRFVKDSLIIFSTATYAYEANAFPSVGFVSFAPSNSSFELWKGFPLRSDSLAIFCLEQDSIEIWIGTNRGVYKINKKNKECEHYGIKKGIVAEDTINLYSDFDIRVRPAEKIPMVAKLAKGDSVEILGVYNDNCEILSPVDILGYVLKSHVKEKVKFDSQSGTSKASVKLDFSDYRHKPHIKREPKEESETLVVFNYRPLPVDRKYILIDSIAIKNNIWYKIKVPTVWFARDNLTFSLGTLKEDKWSCKR